MKVKNCIHCKNETFQEDDICVICKLNLNRIHGELVDLLKQDSKWNSHTEKIAENR